MPSSRTNHQGTKDLSIYTKDPTSIYTKEPIPKVKSKLLSIQLTKPLQLPQHLKPNILLRQHSKSAVNHHTRLFN
jgi:hypothetical protein